MRGAYDLPMQIRRVEDPADFLDAATPLLLADEARHNLMLGIAGTLRDHPSRYPEYRLWLVKERSATVGAALRTPPHKLVLARPRADSALENLYRLDSAVRALHNLLAPVQPALTAGPAGEFRSKLAQAFAAGSCSPSFCRWRRFSR